MFTSRPPERTAAPRRDLLAVARLPAVTVAARWPLMANADLLLDSECILGNGYRPL